MKVLSPLGTTPDTVTSLSKRRASLAGLRIGVLDNSKPNADVLLGRVAEALAAGVDGATIRSWTSSRASSAPPPSPPACRTPASWCWTTAATSRPWSTPDLCTQAAREWLARL